MQYQVNDIYGAIQGEGCQAGIPMVILRLHNCGVACPWCDTKYTWHSNPENERPLAEALGATPLYAIQTEQEITWYLCHQFQPMYKWILLTGGEPAQYDLKPLVSQLHRAGWKVALETSGTEAGHLGAEIDWVCVSPKIDMPGGKQIKPEAFFEAHEVKHVIGKPADIEALDNLLTRIKPFVRNKDLQICLQPVSQSKKATQLCIETVQRRGNLRLSLQLHKFLDLP
jgi:7-carboxy-7-deazaguanine synthase